MKQTVEGITIEGTKVALSAATSTRFNLEIYSNEIDEC
jgi:hypothetical protein